MRQVATLIMFVLLLFVGYSVGTAIAKNNNDMMNNSSSDGMDGVYVVEEEYGVVATPAASATNGKADDMHHSQTDKNTPTSSNTGAVMIEEDVIESAN
ncbi:MAG: hypothetical protein J6Y53_01565 [Alphaproteobacteria bacterium]|nr:hypothetical protein [Alphaproteobacteria bacterium]